MLYGMDVCAPRDLVIAGDTRGNLHFADPRDASVLGALQAHKKGTKARPGSACPVQRLGVCQRGGFCQGVGSGWLVCGASCARALCGRAMVCQLRIDRYLGMCSSWLLRCELGQRGLAGGGLVMSRTRTTLPMSPPNPVCMLAAP